MVDTPFKRHMRAFLAIEAAWAESGRDDDDWHALLYGNGTNEPRGILNYRSSAFTKKRINKSHEVQQSAGRMFVNACKKRKQKGVHE